MPNIISASHFTGNIYLPNVQTSGNAERIRLDAAIAKYEPIYLKALLGYDLYTLFVAGLTDQTAIYETIRDGGTYTDTADITQEWLGFDTVGSSPLANFIYYKHRTDIATDTQGTGEYAGAAENGTRISPASKMCAAWNEMIEWNQKLHDFLVDNETDYPEYRYFTGDIDSRYNELFLPVNVFNI